MLNNIKHIRLEVEQETGLKFVPSIFHKHMGLIAKSIKKFVVMFNSDGVCEVIGETIEHFKDRRFYANNSSNVFLASKMQKLKKNEYEPKIVKSMEKIKGIIENRDDVPNCVDEFIKFLNKFTSEEIAEQILKISTEIIDELNKIDKTGKGKQVIIVFENKDLFRTQPLISPDIEQYISNVIIDALGDSDLFTSIKLPAQKSAFSLYSYNTLENSCLRRYNLPKFKETAEHKKDIAFIQYLADKTKKITVGKKEIEQGIYFRTLGNSFFVSIVCVGREMVDMYDPNLTLTQASSSDLLDTLSLRSEELDDDLIVIMFAISPIDKSNYTIGIDERVTVKRMREVSRQFSQINENKFPKTNITHYLFFEKKYTNLVAEEYIRLLYGNDKELFNCCIGRLLSSLIKPPKYFNRQKGIKLLLFILELYGEKIMKENVFWRLGKMCAISESLRRYYHHKLHGNKITSEGGGIHALNGLLKNKNSASIEALLVKSRRYVDFALKHGKNDANETIEARTFKKYSRDEGIPITSPMEKTTPITRLEKSHLMIGYYS